MADVSVVGRDEELAAVEAFLAEAARGPVALVFSGEPGIGKTVLWGAGVQRARARFGRVLVCRGVEAEASLSFAGLTELLSPVFVEVAESLAPPRRRALEVALRLAEPGGVAPDALAIGLAVVDMFGVLAEGAPLVVALDDVQWLDPASASVLQIALRRLDLEPVGLLATVRRASGSSDPLEPELLFGEERLRRLWLGPLSLGALHRLLEERLGLDLARPELVRLLEASAGNPFFALELGRELARTDARPAEGQQALRVPESLRELLGRRLARLAAETVDVLLHVAALARPTVELVVAVCGDRDGVLRALDEAAGEGVVELDGAQVRFAHPLLASICYEAVPLWRRRAVHRALANAVSEVEERARHLALAADGPDSVAASLLASAAGHAASRGATAAAGELSGLAAELTPADPPLARQRRLEAARFYRLAAEGNRAERILEQLLSEVPAGVERADILFELASTRRGGSPEGIELCTAALAETAADDTRSARLLSHRALFRWLSGDSHGAHSDARDALEKAERVGDPTLLAVTIARTGALETWAAEITSGLLERGAEIEKQLERPLEYHHSPRVALGRRLLRQGELDQARALLEELEAEAAARGDEDALVMLRGFNLAVLEWLAGHWPRALEHVTAALGLAERTYGLHDRELMGRNKALVEADLGLVEQARASAEQALALSQAASDEWFTIANLGVLGRVELALGNLEAAADFLQDLPGRLLAAGLSDPTLTVWADAIETLIALRDLDRARGYLDEYDALGRRLGSHWAVVGAARCRGLLAAAEGDTSAALEVLEQAMAELEKHPYPFERGRTLLCLGMVRRQAQQKRAARDALEQALAIFEELGARVWAEKARAELGRISGRRAPPEELTESERRVAELAAEGRTNKDIAAELYMGVSTVEAHLSRVYRKLGVRRAELGVRLTKQAG